MVDVRVGARSVHEALVRLAGGEGARGLGHLAAPARRRQGDERGALLRREEALDAVDGRVEVEHGEARVAEIDGVRLGVRQGRARGGDGHGRRLQRHLPRPEVPRRVLVLGLRHGKAPLVERGPRRRRARRRPRPFPPRLRGACLFGRAEARAGPDAARRAARRLAPLEAVGRDQGSRE